MIELQVKDNMLFEELKQYADYYSDRTHVVSLPESKRHLLPDNYPVNIVSDDMSLYYNKHNFYISGVDEMAKVYLGLYNIAGTSFSFRSLDKLNDLIEAGVVEGTDELKEDFPKLSKKALVGDLQCSDCGFRVNRKLNRYTAIKSVPLSELFACVERKIKKFDTYQFEIYDSYIEKDKKKRQRLVVAGAYNDETGKQHNLSTFMYGAVSGFAKVFPEGRDVNIILDEKHRFVSFAPLSLIKKEEVIVSPGPDAKKLTKGIPVMLFRIAWEEARLRELIN